MMLVFALVWRSTYPFSIMCTGLYRCVFRRTFSVLSCQKWMELHELPHCPCFTWLRILGWDVAMQCHAPTACHQLRRNSVDPIKLPLFTVILGSFKLRKQRQYPRNTCYEYLLSLPFSFSVFLLHCYSVLLVSEILSNPFLFLASY